MGITYSAPVGTIITSFVMDETLGDQTWQVDNNSVVVSDDIVTLENGQIGDGSNGIGGFYIGRLVIIDLGLSTQQVRLCTWESAGPGNTYILEVHEDWDTNPVATTDTIHVCYELADIEDGGASGGIGLSARTGLWELSNLLTIGNGTDPAGLQIINGQALETDDRGSNTNLINTNNGYIFVGYEAANSPINGGIITAYNNTAAEPWYQAQSGSNTYFYDTLLWAQLVAQQLEYADGSAVKMWGSKIIAGTRELHLYDSELIDSSVSGNTAVVEVVRVDAGTIVDGLILSNINALDTVADTATETIELKGVLFSSVPDFIQMRNNKTWNMIDPVWTVTTYSDFAWSGSTNNEVNDRRSIVATAQESDGTKLQDALVIVYEDTQLSDLVLELTTDSDGFAEDSFIYKKHATNSSTTTYGGHALRVDKWLYTPFVATQVSTESFNGTVTLIDDTNIVQTIQATALSEGSGITWNEDTNPSSIFSYAAGDGTLVSGTTVSGFTSAAYGTATEIINGDSTAGTVHLKDRNSISFTDGETVSGTGTGWSATLTSGTQQDFSIWVDGDSKDLQTIHDYSAAHTSQTTLSELGELIHEWGRDEQPRALYKSGDNFYTEESYSKGIIIVDYGSGNISYFTDDAGGTYVPPATISLDLKVIDEDQANVQDAWCYIEDSIQTELMNEQSLSNGTASASYIYTGDEPVVVRVRKYGFKYYRANQTITSAGLNLTVTLVPDPQQT